MCSIWRFLKHAGTCLIPVGLLVVLLSVPHDISYSVSASRFLKTRVHADLGNFSMPTCDVRLCKFSSQF